MGIIAFLVLGLIAGVIAKALMPGEDAGGIIVTMALGVAGALVGGFIAAALLGVSPVDGFFYLSTWIAAIAGSVVLLAVWRAITGSGTRHGIR